MTLTDVFKPVSTGPIPKQIPTRSDHPVPRLNIVSKVVEVVVESVNSTNTSTLQEQQDSPIPTNKFYANLFLGSQDQGIWTHPYSVVWSKGSGVARSWDSISHTVRG